jgi:hypothetical protein
LCGGRVPVDVCFVMMSSFSSSASFLAFCVRFGASCSFFFLLFAMVRNLCRKNLLGGRTYGMGSRGCEGDM